MKSKPALVKSLAWSEHKSLVSYKLLAFDPFGHEFCRIDITDDTTANEIGLRKKKAEAEYQKVILSVIEPGVGKTVAWRVIAHDGEKGVTDKKDVADQWVAAGLDVRPLGEIDTPTPAPSSGGPNWHAHVGSLLAVIEYMTEATGEGLDEDDAAMVAQINAEYSEASNV